MVFSVCNSPVGCIDSMAVPWSWGIIGNCGMQKIAPWFRKGITMAGCMSVGIICGVCICCCWRSCSAVVHGLEAMKKDGPWVAPLFKFAVIWGTIIPGGICIAPAFMTQDEDMSLPFMSLYWVVGITVGFIINGMFIKTGMCWLPCPAACIIVVDTGVLGVDVDWWQVWFEMLAVGVLLKKDTDKCCSWFMRVELQSVLDEVIFQDDKCTEG